MSTSAPTTRTDRLEAIKARQQATWASGDYSAVATLIVPVAERLVDYADLLSSFLRWADLRQMWRGALV